MASMSRHRCAYRKSECNGRSTHGRETKQVSQFSFLEDILFFLISDDASGQSRNPIFSKFSYANDENPIVSASVRYTKQSKGTSI